VRGGGKDADAGGARRRGGGGGGGGKEPGAAGRAAAAAHGGKAGRKPVGRTPSSGLAGCAPSWADGSWHPMAVMVQSGQLRNGGTGVFIPGGARPATGGGCSSTNTSAGTNLMPRGSGGAAAASSSGGSTSSGGTPPVSGGCGSSSAVSAAGSAGGGSPRGSPLSPGSPAGGAAAPPARGLRGALPPHASAPCVLLPGAAGAGGAAVDMGVSSFSLAPSIHQRGSRRRNSLEVRNGGAPPRRTSDNNLMPQPLGAPAPAGGADGAQAANAASAAAAAAAAVDAAAQALAAAQAAAAAAGGGAAAANADALSVQLAMLQLQQSQLQQLQQQAEMQQQLQAMQQEALLQQLMADAGASCSFALQPVGQSQDRNLLLSASGAGLLPYSQLEPPAPAQSSGLAALGAPPALLQLPLDGAVSPLGFAPGAPAPGGGLSLSAPVNLNLSGHMLSASGQCVGPMPPGLGTIDEQAGIGTFNLRGAGRWW
jgi:hypothetical protein